MPRELLDIHAAEVGAALNARQCPSAPFMPSLDQARRTGLLTSWSESAVIPRASVKSGAVISRPGKRNPRKVARTMLIGVYVSRALVILANLADKRPPLRCVLSLVH